MVKLKNDRRLYESNQEEESARGKKARVPNFYQEYDYSERGGVNKEMCAINSNCLVSVLFGITYEFVNPVGSLLSINWWSLQ